MQKKEIWGFLHDYFYIIVGVLMYVVGYSWFMLPYGITSGGMGGVAAIIYYATGFPAQYGYLLINVLLLAVAIFIMGWRFTARTLMANFIIAILMGVAQEMIRLDDGTLHKLAGDEMFMACVLAGAFEGVGLALVFHGGGSTGGSDIIASCINKYRDIQLGIVMLLLDLVIVGSSYFVFHDVERMVVSYVAMFISMTVLDYVLNMANQSIQITIISSKYETIANTVNQQMDRGVTVLNGMGWYSKEERSVLLIMSKRREKNKIMRLVRSVDPNAFVTVSNVEGVFGEGFDKIKN